MIAKDVTDWKALVPFLGLSLSQEKKIAMQFPGDYDLQKQECLEVWKEMKGMGATYPALIVAAGRAQNEELADRVRSMFSSKLPSKCSPFRKKACA